MIMGGMLNIDFSTNIIAIFTGLLAWFLIGFLVFRIYKRQTVKPKLWKAIVIIFVGLFSFSIHINTFGNPVKIAILPLGVWIIYGLSKGKEARWQRYRPFAWLGFWANYIFLLTTLLTNPVHDLIYPKNEPVTYISNVEDTSIIRIHPNSEDIALNKDVLLKQLHSLKKETITSVKWYEEVQHNTEPNNRRERFPYQLVGATSKWGSDLHAVIYIEEDGKGLLITTTEKQLYFRSEKSLFGEGE
jgi:hypothetical protein